MNIIDHSKEIEQLKNEIIELRKDEKVFNDLNIHLSFLQQKFEKLQEEKHLNEENLEDKLSENMEKLNNLDYEKSKIENELISLSTSLKNKKLELEEQNEMILQKEEDESILKNTFLELEDIYRKTETSLNLISKERSQLKNEKNEKLNYFENLKEKLKEVLKEEKELMEKDKDIQMKLLENCNEIENLKDKIKEMEEEENLLKKNLENSEIENDKMIKIENDLEKEIAEIKQKNESLLKDKENNLKLLKSENQRNLKLESNLSQLNFCLKNLEEDTKGLLLKKEQIEEEISIKEGEIINLNHDIEESKNKLEDSIKVNQMEINKIENIKNTGKSLIKILESYNKENVLFDLKNEFNRILNK